MRRRQFLSATVPAALGLAGGCLANPSSCSDEDRWPPTVRVDALDLAPGGSDDLVIRVDGITGFRFDTRLYRCGATDAPVGFGDVETTPEIAYQVDSCPPTWVWEDCTRVTVRAPVHVAPDAPPGDYEYGFRITEAIGDRHAREYERAVTVTETRGGDPPADD